MKKALDVTILGQKLTISSEADEAYMLKVAGYVDGKMQELMNASRSAAKSNVAMLAALNIADEYYRLKEAYDHAMSKLDQISNRLSVSLSEEG